MVRAWLDSWSGVGHIAETMHEVGYNMRLTRTVFDWRADFSRNELTQLVRWIGSAGDMNWRAVQRAALETLRQEGTAPPR